MRKKCFNQKYGLEQAVLDGRKTMFRDVIKCPSNAFRLRLMRNCVGDWVAEAYDDLLRPIGYIKPAYKVGEIVAIAQAYKDLPATRDFSLLITSSKIP